MSGRRRRPVSVGGASLFAVLIILCLMVFAVLARLTAQSERNLAQKAADSLSAYYDAEYRAIVRLAEIKNPAPDAPETVIFGMMTFTEEIDENRELRVTLDIAGGEVNVIEWAVVIKGDDEGGTEESGFGDLIVPMF